MLLWQPTMFGILYYHSTFYSGHSGAEYDLTAERSMCGTQVRVSHIAGRWGSLLLSLCIYCQGTWSCTMDKKVCFTVYSPVLWSTEKATFMYFTVVPPLCGYHAYKECWKVIRQQINSYPLFFATMFAETSTFRYPINIEICNFFVCMRFAFYPTFIRA